MMATMSPVWAAMVPVTATRSSISWPSSVARPPNPTPPVWTTWPCRPAGDAGQDLDGLLGDELQLGGLPVGARASPISSTAPSRAPRIGPAGLPVGWPQLDELLPEERGGAQDGLAVAGEVQVVLDPHRDQRR